jgi:hypothetical protein
MNSIQKARAALADVLSEIKGLRVYRQLGEVVDPPAVMVSLPRIEYDGRPGEATSATFTIPLFAAMEGDTSDQLAHWEPIVTKVLDGLNDQVTVTASAPGTWPAGGTDLPAYLIEVEVALPWQ